MNWEIFHTIIINLQVKTINYMNSIENTGNKLKTNWNKDKDYSLKSLDKRSSWGWNMKRTCDIFKYEQAIVENLNWT